MLRKTLLLLIALASFTTIFFTHSALAQASPILITEIQTGFIDGSGLEYPKQEFIELTNVSPTSTDMTDWRVEYLSSANDGSGAPTSVLSTFSGRLPLNGRLLFSHIGYVPAPVDFIFGDGDTSTTGLLAKSGGHIRVMNGANMIDCVAWGSAVAIVGCDKTTAPPAGHTIQRPLTDNNSYDKALGVKNMTPPNPEGGDWQEIWQHPNPTDPNNPHVPIPDPEPEVPSEMVCKNIQLSEILANPAGDDAAGEFIELYNNSEQEQSLYGCSIRIGAVGRQYSFAEDAKLAAREYKAFYYSQTTLQLTNSGGEIWLLLSNSQYSAVYPNSTDDQAWALIEGIWQSTGLPTPNVPNALPGILSEADQESTVSEVCPVGKYRNPETNRCKNIEGDTDLTPCSVGQERNPDTGRCRKVVAATASLAACGVGEQRNPDTNRCRKVTTSETTIKACEAGQERNPETNRCRKVITASTNAGASGGDDSKGSQNYRILFIVLSLVMGYAIYEYRQDIKGMFVMLRNRLTGRGVE